LRRLTLKEAAELQTFPSDYIFSGPNSSKYTQIGNAVPCRLAYAVAMAVIDALENKPLDFTYEEKQLALV
jgi:DNA (cytosine-5)-methyltransferase 1